MISIKTELFNRLEKSKIFSDASGTYEKQEYWFVWKSNKQNSHVQIHESILSFYVTIPCIYDSQTHYSELIAA